MLLLLLFSPLSRANDGYEMYQFGVHMFVYFVCLRYIPSVSNVDRNKTIVNMREIVCARVFKNRKAATRRRFNRTFQQYLFKMTKKHSLFFRYVMWEKKEEECHTQIQTYTHLHTHTCDTASFTYFAQIKRQIEWYETHTHAHKHSVGKTKT